MGNKHIHSNYRNLGQQRLKSGGHGTCCLFLAIKVCQIPVSLHCNSLLEMMSRVYRNPQTPISYIDFWYCMQCEQSDYYTGWINTYLLCPQQGSIRCMSAPSTAWLSCVWFCLQTVNYECELSCAIYTCCKCHHNCYLVSWHQITGCWHQADEIVLVQL